MLTYVYVVAFSLSMVFLKVFRTFKNVLLFPRPIEGVYHLCQPTMHIAIQILWNNLVSWKSNSSRIMFRVWR